jgi:hypothetical protein
MIRVQFIGWMLLLGGLVTFLGPGCRSMEVSICVDSDCPVGYACDEGARCIPLEQPSTTGKIGRYTDVALRSDGRRVIATYDATNTNLVVLLEKEDGSFDTRIIAGWQMEEHGLVDTDSGHWNAITLDNDGALHLAWFDASKSSLHYGKLPVDGDDSAVSTETVAGGDSIGSFSHVSLAVGQDGSVHLAYRNDTKLELRYAKRSADGLWSEEELDGCAGEMDCPGPDEDYGEFAEVVLIADSPKIAFYDRLRGDLKLAEPLVDGSWQVVTLDGRDLPTDIDSGDVGRFISVAVDSQQRLGIAYHDATRGALRYLSANEPSPTPLVVDDGVYWDEDGQSLRNHPVGQHVATSFDAQDRAVMLYLDAGRLRIKHAVVSGHTVLGPVDVDNLSPGAYISFGIAPDGTIRGAYGAWIVSEGINTELAHLLLTGVE